MDKVLLRMAQATALFIFFSVTVFICVGLWIGIARMVGL